MARLLAVAALLTLSVACAFQRAMIRGAKNAEEGDWVAAAEAYQIAAGKRPDDPEVAKKLADAQSKAIAAEVQAAREALARSDYEASVAALKRAEAYNADDPEVFTATREVEGAIEAALLSNWETSDPRDVYALAVRAEKLFPKAAYLPAMFQHMRQHFIAQSEKLFDQRQFKMALVALGTITEFEPDQKGAIAPLEQRVRTAWADDLDASAAKQAAAKRPGAAAILYARAFEVANRGADLVKGKSIAEKLAADARLTLKLDASGPPERVAALRTTILSGIKGIPDTVTMTTAPVELALKIVVTAPRCTERDIVTPSTKDYVSGQIQKPNPQHQELAKSLAAAIAEEKAAKAESERLWPELKAAEALLSRLDAAFQTAKTAHDQAEAGYSQAETQLASARTRRDELDAQLDAARTSGGDVRTLEMQLQEASKRVTEWTNTLLTREDETEATRKALAKIEAARAPATESKDALSATYQDAVNRRTAAQSSTGELSSRLVATPKTVMEDVHETLRYDVHDWTRTCTAPVAASVVTTWPTLLPKSHAFTPESRTADRSHIGHAASGLALDPKSFPDSDTGLVAAGDAATAQEIVRWATALAEDHYARSIESAVKTWETNPDAAATAIVSLYVGVPSRLQAETIASFEQAVAGQYGLEKLALLK